MRSRRLPVFAVLALVSACGDQGPPPLPQVSQAAPEPKRSEIPWSAPKGTKFNPGPRKKARTGVEGEIMADGRFERAWVSADGKTDYYAAKAGEGKSIKGLGHFVKVTPEGLQGVKRYWGDRGLMRERTTGSLVSDEVRHDYAQLHPGAFERMLDKFASAS